MPEARLQRTRAAYAPFDPTTRLAIVYLRHAASLTLDGRACEAFESIDEAARILGLDPRECRAVALRNA